jgi:hypothetical protein
LIPKVCFLAAFAAGLGLAVYSMLHGVERSKGTPRHRPSPLFNTPAASVFLVVLGAIGYLLVTRSRVGVFTILVIGVVSASIATAGAIVLLAQWALPYYGSPDGDERIQGVLARVTRTISPSDSGEITFQANGISHKLPAESIHGSEIPCDAEVVIDTIRNGVARVELWSSVEQRL